MGERASFTADEARTVGESIGIDWVRQEGRRRQANRSIGRMTTEPTSSCTAARIVVGARSARRH